MVPGSLGAVVVDLDPDDDTAPAAAPPATGNGAIVQGANGRAVHLNEAAVAALASAPAPPLGAPVLQHATRRAGGVHFWYKAPPGEEVGNRKWARTAGGRIAGDIRGTNGYAILWNPGAVAAAVTGGDFDFADVVDPSTLHWPAKGKGSDIEQMRAAKNGERNDLLNRLAFARAQRGENMLDLRTAAIATGLTVDEVSATIRSAEEGAQRNPKKKSTQHGAYHAARAMEAALSTVTMFVAGRGWYYRGSETALWQPDTGRVMLAKVQSHPERERCQRGLRSSAIMGELEGMIDVDGATLDADDWTCGLPNGAGILDVRTGEVRPSTANDRVTKALGVVPDFTAPPEVLPWYLAELTAGCREPEKVQEFIRWYWRRSLTGDCSAEVMLFLYGPPRTGKSKLGELMLYVAGDYGHFLDARNIVGNGVEFQHPTWLAACAGKRLILASDLPPGGSWQTGTVQDAVSGSPMTARQMRQDGFTFVSQMHFICTGNHAPRAPHGAGIWDRLRMVACKNQHVDNPNTTLPERLKAEAPRILGWVLGAPDEQPNVPELGDMTANMRDESDPVGAWIKRTWRYDADGRIPAAECYQRYSDVFGADKDARIMGDRSFGELMTEQYGEPSFSHKRAGKVVKVRRLAAL